MKIHNLSDNAIEIQDCDLRTIDPEIIKDFLFKNQIVIFKNQPLKVLPFAKLCEQIGNGFANANDFFWNQKGELLKESIPNLSALNWNKRDEDFPVQRVTGEKNEKNKFHAGYSGIFPEGHLEWHSNFNYPGQADCIGLQAVRGVLGTGTSFLNLVHVFNELPDSLKKRAENNYALYKYNPREWAIGSSELQLQILENAHLKEFKFDLVQENKAGIKGLFFSFNNRCSIPNDPELFEELRSFCLQERFMYHHNWDIGDIVLSEQVLSLHMRKNYKNEILQNRLLHRITFYLSEVNPKDGEAYYKESLKD